MKINRIHLITFSPTKTSLRIGKAISEGIEAESVVISDYTNNIEKDLCMDQDDIAIISLPVYGGHIAPLAMKRIEHIMGNNTPTVIVAVYGNRDYEMALNDMATFCTSHSLNVIAAGTFIGEHSYSTQQTPIAVGRPDLSDLEYAKEFGQRIQEKINRADSWEGIMTIDINDIERPTQNEDAVHTFKSTIAGWMKNGNIKPTSPTVNEELCTKCGLCVKLCPTAAIPLDNPSVTLTDKCIKCCACVKGCQQKARTLETPFAKLLADNFTERKENKVLM